MAKVSHSLSITFRVGDASNQFAKINLEVNDIDTDLPIEEQLRNVENATDVVWSYLRNKLDREIEEILNDKDV